jgi:hypothetical protein
MENNIGQPRARYILRETLGDPRLYHFREVSRHETLKEARAAMSPPLRGEHYIYDTTRGIVVDWHNLRADE